MEQGNSSVEETDSGSNQATNAAKPLKSFSVEREVVSSGETMLKFSWEHDRTPEERNGKYYVSVSVRKADAANMNRGWDYAYTSDAVQNMMTLVVDDLGNYVFDPDVTYEFAAAEVPIDTRVPSTLSSSRFLVARPTVPTVLPPPPAIREDITKCVSIDATLVPKHDSRITTDDEVIVTLKTECTQVKDPQYLGIVLEFIHPDVTSSVCFEARPAPESVCLATGEETTFTHKMRLPSGFVQVNASLNARFDFGPGDNGQYDHTQSWGFEVVNEAESVEARCNYTNISILQGAIVHSCPEDLAVKFRFVQDAETPNIYDLTKFSKDKLVIENIPSGYGILVAHVNDGKNFNRWTYHAMCVRSCASYDSKGPMTLSSDGSVATLDYAQLTNRECGEEPSTVIASIDQATGDDYFPTIFASDAFSYDPGVTRISTPIDETANVIIATAWRSCPTDPVIDGVIFISVLRPKDTQETPTPMAVGPLTDNTPLEESVPGYAEAGKVSVDRLISPNGNIPVLVPPGSAGVALEASSVLQLLSENKDLTAVQVLQPDGSWRDVSPILGAVVSLDSTSQAFSVRLKYKNGRAPEVFTSTITKESVIEPITAVTVVEAGSITQQTSSTMNSDSSSTFPWWLVVLVLALIVILVVVTRRNIGNKTGSAAS